MCLVSFWHCALRVKRVNGKRPPSSRGSIYCCISIKTLWSGAALQNRLWNGLKGLSHEKQLSPIYRIPTGSPTDHYNGGPKYFAVSGSSLNIKWDSREHAGPLLHTNSSLLQSYSKEEWGARDPCSSDHWKSQ